MAWKGKIMSARMPDSCPCCNRTFIDPSKRLLLLNELSKLNIDFANFIQDLSIGKQPTTLPRDYESDRRK